MTSEELSSGLTDLTPSEQELYKEIVEGYGTPLVEEKQNVHNFLNKVATSRDTTKVGNLNTEEVGMPKHPLRVTKELSLISSDLMDNDVFSNYFKKEAEIITSTSLSKDAKLINLAVIQKKEIADVSAPSQPMKENSGWFKSKKQNSFGGV